ncbi:MAG: hypothetical protein ACRD23_08510 [Terriglobales bacterium]
MRHLLVLSVLLLGATWAAGQNYPSQKKSANTGSQTTVQGCLSGSAGNYMLTDKKGNTFDLTGDTAKLNEHVGHEMKVTGTKSAASASTSGAAAGSTMGQAHETIDVTSFKHISKTCQSGGASH